MRGDIARRTNGRCSILVIDDELDMVEMIAFGLTRLGYDVDTATDGRDALAMASRKFYHIAISDLRMPTFDGIMTLLALKDCTPSTDVVIVTAYATDEVFSECEKNGAAYCLKKPFTTEQLASVIESLLAKRPLPESNAAS